MRGSSSRTEYAVLDRGSACLQCKRRKKRCDGAKPICGPCVRFGTADQCEFPRPPTPKLKPKPSPPRSKSEALRMQIRELEDQLAALQKAVGASQQAKDAISAAGNASLLVPHPKGDSYDYDMGQQQREDMDEDTTFYPKIESPLPHSASPEPIMFTNRQALSEELLHVFLRHRRRCAFECDEGRFAFQFLAPADSPDALHPGLVSAVLLLGCHFASSTIPSILSSHRPVNNVADLEAYFLQQTCDKLAKSLTAADRLGDFLRGTAILVWYYFAKGRIAEAQYHASGVSCFASACRLHLLSNPSLANLGQPIPPSASAAAAAAGTTSSAHGDGHGGMMMIQNQPTQIIAPAKSHIELEERISLFWTIFVLDRYAALLCDTNTSIRDEAVWTSWPRDADEWDLARAELPPSLVLSPPSPETLFPVLDYSVNTPTAVGRGNTSSGSSTSSSGSGGVGAANNETMIIPRSDLSHRVVSVLLLERSTRLAKATNGSLAALYREYDMPYLQRSFDATHATARRITAWLAPSSVLLQLGSTTTTPPPAPAVAPGQHFGHHGHPGHPHHAHAAHLPSHQHPASAGPAAMIGLGTTSLSPHVFHSLPGTAEGAAGPIAGGGVSGSATSSIRTAGPFHLHLHHPHPHQHQQQPPSPLHRHLQAGISGGDFPYRTSGEGTSGLRGFKSPAEAAALLFCHSALNTTWIHLNNARRVIPPSSSLDINLAPSSSLPQSQMQRQQSVMAQGPGARSGSGELYRPPPPQQSRPSSSSSIHTHPDVPMSAAAIYQHTQQLAHPNLHAPTSQAYHHQQHPAYGSYSATQPPSLSIPSAVPGPKSGVSSTAGPSPWTTWPPESDHSLAGIEAMDIPPWISTSGAVPGTSDSRPGPFQASYTQQAPQQPQYTFQTAQIPPQRYPPQLSPTTPIDTADIDFSGKSSLVAAREIADLASTALALPAIFDELDMTIGITWTVAVQVLSDEIHRRENIHARDRRGGSGSRHNSSIGHDSPSHPHFQQIPGQQPSYHYPTTGHFTSPSPIEHPGTPTHPSYLRGPAGEADDVDVLASIGDQRDILMHALDRLSGMFQLVGASSSSSSPSSRSHRRTTSSSPFSSASSASSSTAVSLSEEMMMIGGGLSPYVGIVEGEMEGCAVGFGVENVEADSFDPSSPFRCDADLFPLNGCRPTDDYERSHQLPYYQQPQHGHVKTGAPDTTLITPAGQVPQWTTLPNDCSQIELNFFNNVGPSELELLYTL